MQKFANATPCYTPNQIYQFEKNWFAENSSFGLMQQASWQMATWLKSNFSQIQKTVLIAVGNGNQFINGGGDGWALAGFLTQLCPNWNIAVLEIALPTTENAKHAKALFNGTIVDFNTFFNLQENGLALHFDFIIDGLFGIGLNKAPTGVFTKIIDWINAYKQRFANCQIISIDVPSGLNATDGKVYDKVAIKADITLCLIARKVGLHLQDSKDYVGKVVDLPLMPVITEAEYFYHKKIPPLPKRPQTTHKGSYGHALIIGGNQLDTGNEKGQGMAGASLLSASCAFAVGVGKVTVACHANFHSAMITALPNAMTADLQNTKSVTQLIEQVDVVALGMGLGRDKKSFDLFKSYLQVILDHDKKCVIDADGLYHLADLVKSKAKTDKNIIQELQHSEVYFTPHSGEAGRLLSCDFSEVDSDKITALHDLAQQYGGTWLIKGANTLVLENGKIQICGLGNAGMATAGMGDCLAGVVAGLLAQSKVVKIDYPLLTATLIHAKAGDRLAKKLGENALSANNMAKAVGKVLQH